MPHQGRVRAGVDLTSRTTTVSRCRGESWSLGHTWWAVSGGQRKESVNMIAVRIAEGSWPAGA